MMRAVSCWQPFASMIAKGNKVLETRGYPTKYRGGLLIHAAKTTNWELRRYANVFHHRAKDMPTWLDLPRGAFIAVCNLVDCIPTEAAVMMGLSTLESLAGDFSIGRYAWVLEDVRELKKPYEARGYQGMWQVDATGDLAIELLTWAKETEKVRSNGTRH